jgi:hypothetical protein
MPDMFSVGHCEVTQLGASEREIKRSKRKKKEKKRKENAHTLLGVV